VKTWNATQEDERPTPATGPGAPTVRAEVAPATGRVLIANAGAMLAARWVVAALGWLGTILIVRRLSVAEFGRFTFVFSLLGLLSVFTELGLARNSVKGLLNEDDDPAAFAGNLVMLRATLGIIVYAAAVAFVIAAGYPAEIVRATAVAGGVVLLATPSHAMEVVFQVRLRMGIVALTTVIGQMVQLALTVAIATAGGSVVFFAIPAVVCEAVILAVRVAKMGSLLRVRLAFDWGTWVQLLREAAPLALGAVLATFYYRVDSVMLSKLDTFTAVGIYGVAYKFVDVIHYVPAALMTPVLAMLVRAWPDDPSAFADTFRRAFTILTVSGVLMVVEFTVFARPLITTLYGQQYAPGAQAARLVVASECLYFFGSLAVTTLIAMGHHRLYPLVALLGLVLNVALNVWLIPAQSYEGAAIATLVTEGAVVVVLWIALAGRSAVPSLPLRTVPLAVVGGALTMATAVAASMLVAWPAAAAVAAALYVTFLHIARVPGPGGLPALLRDPEPA